MGMGPAIAKLSERNTEAPVAIVKYEIHFWPIVVWRMLRRWPKHPGRSSEVYAIMNRMVQPIANGGKIALSRSVEVCRRVRELSRCYTRHLGISSLLALNPDSFFGGEKRPLKFAETFRFSASTKLGAFVHPPSINPAMYIPDSRKYRVSIGPAETGGFEENGNVH